MKRAILAATIIFTTALFVISCSDGTNPDNSTGPENTAASGIEEHGDMIQPGDVQLATPLNKDWVASGKNIYDLKCQSCHKLTDEKVVGPGWKGVTQRREPHWIMNMITNVDVMLEKDPEAQKLLEQCLVRMPNQNISKDDARQVLEFMRNNDGVQ